MDDDKEKSAIKKWSIRSPTLSKHREYRFGRHESDGARSREAGQRGKHVSAQENC
jgi:hypothetical protein